MSTAPSAASPSRAPSVAAPRQSWFAAWLPPAGFERAVFILCAVVLLGLKVLAIYHFRADSDETQHAHIVWGWATGRIQYRDLFDNHMPLFQMAFAPLMALLGERADILIPLRWAMLPIYLLCVWAVYRIALILYSRRAAAWAALAAAAAGKFFYTSTEFRTDDLWALFWLLALLIAIGGAFTVRRAFFLGLFLGLAFAVSMKTVVLCAALACATALAFGPALRYGGLAAICGGGGVGGATLRLLAILAGALIAPVAVISWFAAKGIFWSMYYCVISHNILPHLKRWGNFALYQAYFPLSLILCEAYAWLAFSTTPSRPLALRRAIISATPWIFLCLLLSYWPDITREDDLPYIPLLPLSLGPLLIFLGVTLRRDSWTRKFWTVALPLLLLCETGYTIQEQNLRQDRLRVASHHIADVLAITRPGDFVMDEKGDYVFRPRAYYWVLEPITKARIRSGIIRDNLPSRLIQHGVKVCYFHCVHAGSIAAQFIVANYLPVDPEALDIGVLGKIICPRQPDPAGDPFNIVIPQRYAVITENGTLAGQLDGHPYTGPVWLVAGQHRFLRTSGSGCLAFLLADAVDKGFQPLFDAEPRIIEEVATLPPERVHRGPELQ